MKKFKILFAVIIAIILLVIVLIVFLSQSIKIGNEKIHNEEFLLYLKDNILRYDTTLRNENNIPEGTTVLEYFNNDQNLYCSKLLNKNIEFISNIKAQQLLAQNYGIEKKLSYDELIEKMNEENETRINKINNGEKIYGIQEFDTTNYIQYYLDSLKNKVIEQLLKQYPIKNEDIEDNYKKMQQPLYTENEKVQYTYYFLDENQNFSIGNLKEYETQQITLNFSEIKNLIKEKSIDEFLFLNFDENIVSKVFKKDGKNVFVQYNGFIKDNNLSQQDKEIIKYRIINELYEKEVFKLVSSFEIKNKRGGKRLIKSFLKAYQSN